MSTAHSRGNSIKQEVVLSSGQTAYFDEPREKGGTASAPTPVESLGAALAACTASTLRLYSERKGWDMTGLEVQVSMEFERYTPSSFTVKITFPEGLDEEQVERLHQIAEKCPVHKTLAGSPIVEVV